MGQKPHRRRQTRDGVVVESDDQSRVLSPRVELEDAAVLAVRAPRRTEAAGEPAVDRRRVRRHAAVRGAGLIVGIGIGRRARELRFAELDGAPD